MTFQPKITHARIVLSPFTSEQMLSIGNALATSVKKRIQSGTNADDKPAKPLKAPVQRADRKFSSYKATGYAQWKSNHGLAPIRDWTGITHRLLRALNVVSVNENGGKVGFTDDRSDKVAHALNRIDKAFGISPTDRQNMQDAFVKILRSPDSNIVEFERAA